MWKETVGGSHIWTFLHVHNPFPALEQGRQAGRLVFTVSSMKLFLYTKTGRVQRHRLSSPSSIPTEPCLKSPGLE